jgi:hypothetical protein
MRTCIILWLLSLSVSAQVGGDQRENQLLIYEFVLSNLADVQRHTSVEAFDVELQFNDASVLDNVTYRPIIKNSSGKYKVDHSKRAVVWSELDALIRKSFAFIPSTSFERVYGQTTSIGFGVSTNEKDLKSGIANLQKERSDVATKFAEDEAEGVVKDSRFTIEAILAARGKFFPKINTSGALTAYNSQAIELAPGYYLVFNVITTSVNGMFRQKVQYAVHHTYGESSELLFKNTEEIISGRAILDPPGDEESVITIEGSADANFEMNVTLLFENKN